MRVLVAPDKFKGSLSAPEVAEAIGLGLRDSGVDHTALPLADGGDGSVAAALAAGFSARPVTVRGATGQPVDTEFAFDGTTAVVEVAGTCGLGTLPERRLAPMASSSYGFGQAVRAAVDAGAQRVVLALGGSASTDGGTGMLAALGLRLLDAAGEELTPAGGSLASVTDVETAALADLSHVDLVVAVDVDNPLLGAEGAAAVFGPQKGATPSQVDQLDAGLAHLVQVLERNPGFAPSALLARRPGAGAAGGLGFACLLLGARRVIGAEYFLDLLGFDDAVADCDVVVSGEGRLDRQTLGGKLPSVVFGRSGHRRTFAVVGSSGLTPEEQRSLGVEDVYELSALTDEDPRDDPRLSRDLAREAGRRIGAQLLGVTAAS